MLYAGSICVNIAYGVLKGGSTLSNSTSLSFLKFSLTLRYASSIYSNVLQLITVRCGNPVVAVLNGPKGTHAYG